MPKARLFVLSTKELEVVVSVVWVSLVGDFTVCFIVRGVSSYSDLSKICMFIPGIRSTHFFCLAEKLSTVSAPNFGHL